MKECCVLNPKTLPVGLGECNGCLFLFVCLFGCLFVCLFGLFGWLSGLIVFFKVNINLRHRQF